MSFTKMKTRHATHKNTDGSIENVEDKLNQISTDINNLQDSATDFNNFQTNLANNTDASKGTNLVGNSIITVNNVAEMQALTNLVVGQKITTLGYFDIGDGGHNTYKVVPLDTGTVAQGYISGNATVQFKGLFPNDINAKQFGIVGDGSADDSTAIANAIDTTLFLGRKVIILNNDCYCPTTKANRAEVIFVGKGQLIDSFKSVVVSEKEPTTPFIFNDLIPRIHLKNFNNNASPVVVLVGDSTASDASDNPTFIDSTSSISHLLNDALVRYNPDKWIRLINRSISGTTFQDLVTKPGAGVTLPSWYTDSNADWLDYIESLNPDVIFINLGYNDTSLTLTDNHILLLLQYLKAFSKPMDIIFITPMAVSLSNDLYGGGFSGSETFQRGMDNNAGLIRSVCQWGGYGLIDAHRLSSIMVNGFDPVDTYNRRVASNIWLPVNGAFEADVECTDFAIKFSVVGDAATMDTLFKEENTTKTFIRVGQSDFVNNGLETSDVVIFYKETATGNLILQFWTDAEYSSSSPYTTINTGFVFPTSTFIMEVFRYKNTFGMIITMGTTVVFRNTYNIICGGDKFKPCVKFYDKVLTHGPITELIYFNASEPKKYKPVLTPNELWGTANSDANIKLPYGGNGINNYSSLGVSKIFTPLFNREVLSAHNYDLPFATRTLYSTALGNYYTKILETELSQDEIVDLMFIYQVVSDGVKQNYASGIITFRLVATFVTDGLGYVSYQIAELVPFNTAIDNTLGIDDFTAVVTQELVAGGTFKVDLYYRIGANEYSNLELIPLNVAATGGVYSVGKTKYRFLDGQPIITSLPAGRQVKANESITSWVKKPKTGTGLPTTTPKYVGEMYLDTSAKKTFQAFGTSSSADWFPLN